MFKKAKKENLRLRMALCGPAGAGKTYSALSVAAAMGGKIAVVDTEHGSASKYADIFDFDVVEPAIFDPRDLIKTIQHAEKSGYAHIIIDSLSHYWSGKGGELEMVDNAAARSKTANTFTAWKTVTPVHNELIETIIGSKINVFVTMRTKTEYVVENVNGKQVPRKIGLAPVMRDGIEYEFDVCGDIDQENNFIVTKSRCPEISGKSFNRPGAKMAGIISEWLNSAKSTEVPRPDVKNMQADKIPVARSFLARQAAQIEAEAIEPITLAEKLTGENKPADEFVPGEIIPESVPEVKAAERPNITGLNIDQSSKNAGEIAAEIKKIRVMAQNYGCKSTEDFAQLMNIAVGRDVTTAVSLNDDERTRAIEFLTAASQEANNG